MFDRTFTVWANIKFSKNIQWALTVIKFNWSNCATHKTVKWESLRFKLCARRCNLKLRDPNFKVGSEYSVTYVKLLDCSTDVKVTITEIWILSTTTMFGAGNLTLTASVHCHILRGPNIKHNHINNTITDLICAPPSLHTKYFFRPEIQIWQWVFTDILQCHWVQLFKSHHTGLSPRFNFQAQEFKFSHPQFKADSEHSLTSYLNRCTCSLKQI